MDDKMKLYAWACGVIRDNIEDGAFGTLTISMANGKISGIKKETNIKPNIDGDIKQ